MAAIRSPNLSSRPTVLVSRNWREFLGDVFLWPNRTTQKLSSLDSFSRLPESFLQGARVSFRLQSKRDAPTRKHKLAAIELLVCRPNVRATVQKSSGFHLNHQIELVFGRARDPYDDRLNCQSARHVALGNNLRFALERSSAESGSIIKQASNWRLA